MQSEGVPARVGRDVTAAFARFFEGGVGPSGTALQSAFDFVELPDVPPGSKAARVRAAFELASSDDQKLRLADEVLNLLRADGAFDTEQDTVVAARSRLRTAFARAGLSLDTDGYLAESARDLPSTTRSSKDPMATLDTRYTRELAESVGEVRKRDDQAPALESDRPAIFLVHGRDTAARNDVEVFITRTTGITPTILMFEANQGRTLIEKFELHADRSGFAVVLMTADDEGGIKGSGATRPRARQNVVFEFGYFVGGLRRSHVAALVEEGVEHPSDLSGLVYIPYPGDSWKEDLRREMRAAGVPIIA